jgi:deglycase
MARIAMIADDMFEDVELRQPYDRLREAGHEVVLVGLEKGKQITGKQGREKLTIERGVQEVRADEFDALVIPGGYSPDKLRADDRFVEFVRAFDATGRPLAAVCHGPQLLLTAELQRGRTLTAWPTVQGDLRQAGANVVDRDVVVDDNWITSRKPDDLEAFTSKFVEELGELEERGGWRHGHAGATTESYPHG